MDTVGEFPWTVARPKFGQGGVPCEPVIPCFQPFNRLRQLYRIDNGRPLRGPRERGRVAGAVCPGARARDVVPALLWCCFASTTATPPAPSGLPSHIPSESLPPDRWRRPSNTGMGVDRSRGRWAVGRGPP